MRLSQLLKDDNNLSEVIEVPPQSEPISYKNIKYIDTGNIVAGYKLMSSRGKDHIIVGLSHNLQIISKLILAETTISNENILQIKFSFTDPSYAGQNLIYQLIVETSKLYNIKIASDRQLSPGAKKYWLKLLNNSLVYNFKTQQFSVPNKDFLNKEDISTILVYPK